MTEAGTGLLIQEASLPDEPVAPKRTGLFNLVWVGAALMLVGSFTQWFTFSAPLFRKHDGIDGYEIKDGPWVFGSLGDGLIEALIALVVIAFAVMYVRTHSLHRWSRFLVTAGILGVIWPLVSLVMFSSTVQGVNKATEEGPGFGWGLALLGSIVVVVGGSLAARVAPAPTKRYSPTVIRESSPLHWAIRIVAVAALAIVAISIAGSAQPSTLGSITEACTLAIAAVGLNLLLGFNGQISIGHSTFAGLAAFTAGYTVNSWEWNPYWSLVAGLVLCFFLGLALGLPALRLKGPYLALVTLAVAFVWPTIAAKFLDRKVKASTIKGTALKPLSWTGLEIKGKDARLDRAIFLYWVAIVLLVASYVIVRNLRKSRIGRSLVAVRDNETAAAVMGVNLKFTKTVTFGISAAIGGASGWLTAGRLATMDENTFTILTSIKYLLALFLGGAATLAGPVVGAFTYFFADDYLKEHAPEWDWLPGPLSKGPVASFLLGVLVILFVFVAPFGLVGYVKGMVRKLFVVAPRPLRRTPVAPIVDTPDGDRPSETK